MYTSYRPKPSKVLWYINLGFVLIILLSWLDELIALPFLIWGGPDPHGNWRESAMESFFVLPIWVIVYVFTKRIINRVHYLESFLTVCAWCRKIHYDDKWVPLEEYLTQGFQTKTSHGICPTCAKSITPQVKPPAV